MIAHSLNTIVSIISRIAASNGNAEIDTLLAKLNEQAGAIGATQEASELATQFAALSAVLRDYAIADRGMNLLIETAQDLSSTLSLEELLQKIVTRARAIANANIAWITMLDEEEHVFRNFATEGNLSPGTSQLIAKPDFGVVSKIIGNQDFFTTANYLADTRFNHAPNLDTQFVLEKIVSLAGFPVYSGNRIEGVLFIADRYSREYSGREISVLGSFAQHVGVALENARTFTQLAQTLESMDQNQRSLEDHIQRVENSARTHDDMTSLLAKGADLQTFMKRMASQINGSIFYLDQTYSIREDFTDPKYDGEMAEKVRIGAIDHARLLKAMSQSRESGRAAVLDETGDERSLVLALHGGSQLRDCLIICHKGSIDKIQLRNLERSTVALSIAKLWADKRQNEQLVASSTLLRHLVLTSRPDEQTISSVRERLSLGGGARLCLALISISGIERMDQTELIRKSANRLNLLVDLIDDDYLAVGSLAAVTKLTETLSQHPRHVQIGGIISTPLEDIRHCASTYSKLRSAMMTIQKISPLKRFANQNQIGLLGRIFEQSDPQRIAALVATTLAPIETRDPRNRSELKRTLLAYFDNQFNIARTAGELGVHVNTVRQRLETLRHVTGDWDGDPVFALELHVMLRLDALTTADQPP